MGQLQKHQFLQNRINNLETPPVQPQIYLVQWKAAPQPNKAFLDGGIDGMPCHNHKIISHTWSLLRDQLLSSSHCVPQLFAGLPSSS